MDPMHKKRICFLIRPPDGQNNIQTRLKKSIWHFSAVQLQP